MYYIVLEATGQIVEVSGTMSDALIQEAADYYEGSVYAIAGQHSGFCAAPTATHNLKKER